jgi:hypothetical protein
MYVTLLLHGHSAALNDHYRPSWLICVTRQSLWPCKSVDDSFCVYIDLLTVHSVTECYESSAECSLRELITGIPLHRIMYVGPRSYGTTRRN